MTLINRQTSPTVRFTASDNRGVEAARGCSSRYCPDLLRARDGKRRDTLSGGLPTRGDRRSDRIDNLRPHTSFTTHPSTLPPHCTTRRMASLAVRTPVR